MLLRPALNQDSVNAMLNNKIKTCSTLITCWLVGFLRKQVEAPWVCCTAPCSSQTHRLFSPPATELLGLERPFDLLQRAVVSKPQGDS
jgi:hypothetical protein